MMSEQPEWARGEEDASARPDAPTGPVGGHDHGPVWPQGTFGHPGHRPGAYPGAGQGSGAGPAGLTTPTAPQAPVSSPQAPAQGHAPYGYPNGPAGPFPYHGDGGPGPGGAGQVPPPPPPSWAPASSTNPYGYGGTWAPSAPAQGARALRAAAAVLVVVAAAVAGAGVSRAVWPGSTGASANQATPPTTPPPVTSPFGGSGGNGGGLSPFFGGGTGAGSGAAPTEGAGGPSDVSAIAAKVDPAVVDINSTFNYQGESGAGTGIVLSPDGLVLTNNHVIAESTKLTATDVGNGQTYTATVLGYDNTHDVALVQLQGASGLAAATLATSQPSTGEAVVAIGNAGGTGGTPTSAGGSVTALDQSINASDALTGGSENLSGLIEVNANIQSGDSGGPLVDSQGQVIGMDTAAEDTFSFSAQGNQGYAIPISQASAIAKVIQSGSGNSLVHVGPTAFLGVMIGSSGTSTSPFSGPGATTTVPVRGVPVSQVIGGSPASAAGITGGSTITSFAGRPLTTGNQLTHLLVPYHPGQKAPIAWTDAQGASHTATVTLASGPPS